MHRRGHGVAPDGSKTTYESVTPRTTQVLSHPHTRPAGSRRHPLTAPARKRVYSNRSNAERAEVMSFHFRPARQPRPSIGRGLGQSALDVSRTTRTVNTTAMTSPLGCQNKHVYHLLSGNTCLAAIDDPRIPYRTGTRTMQVTAWYRCHLGVGSHPRRLVDQDAARRSVSCRRI